MNQPNVMAGTLTPEQMTASPQQQAIIDALRGGTGSQQFNPSATTGVQGSSQGFQMSQPGMSTIGDGLNYGMNNIATANRYGTDIGSQQTGMLQAQDAGMF